MKRNYMAVLCIMALTVSVLAGCSSEGKKLKNSLKDALINQEKIESYTFNGSVVLQLDNQLSGAKQNPLTTGFLALLMNSKITWSGVASNEIIAQLESDITIQPAGSASTIDLPIIIKDNKLYFNIPALNINPNEHLYMDLPEKNADVQGTMFSAIFKHVFEGIHPKYYKEIEDDNKSTQTIAIDINHKNGEEILNSIYGKLPLIIDDLQSNRFITENQANNFRNRVAKDSNETLKNIVIDKPGRITLVLNEEGFIVNQQINLYYSNQSIEYTYTIDKINESPEFIKTLPEQTRSFNDIIEQLIKTDK